MKIVTLKSLPLYSILGLLIVCMHMFINIDPKEKPIEMCPEFQTEQKGQMGQPFYVEHVTTEPMLFHISEPIRITLKVKVPLKDASFFNDKWISIYTLDDSSDCFSFNEQITKVMKEKSDDLHHQLQKRMYE